MAAGQMDRPADGPVPRRGWPGGRLPPRRTDRVEATAAVILLALAFVLIGGGWLAGLGTYEEAARHEAALGPRQPISAVVTDAGPPTDPYGASAATPTRATVRWMGADRLAHDAAFVTSEPTPPGTAVTIWLDERGQIAPVPADPSSASVAGVVVGLLVVVGSWSLLLAGWLGVRRATALLNHARWATEWSRVEPLWSGRSGRDGRPAPPGSG